MRIPLLALLAFFLIAATPAEEAERLLGQGQDRPAFELIERAAAGGDVEAVDYLGWFYDNGRAVAQDQPRAVGLYRQAAERGNSHAQWRLGVMLDLGEGVTENPAEALSWIRRSAAQNYARAHVS